jgi:hypothetical protein
LGSPPSNLIVAYAIIAVLKYMPIKNRIKYSMKNNIIANGDKGKTKKPVKNNPAIKDITNIIDIIPEISGYNNIVLSFRINLKLIIISSQLLPKRPMQIYPGISYLTFYQKYLKLSIH